MIVSYDGRAVVTVTHKAVKLESFDEVADMALEILACFNARNYNVWGMEGVGYHILKQQGLVQVHKSTVGPKMYKQGLESVMAKFLNIEVINA